MNHPGPGPRLGGLRWIGGWLLLVLMLPQAAQALLLEDDTAVNAVQGLRILEDPEQALGLEDVLALPPEAFEVTAPNLGYRRGAIWGRLELDNRSRYGQWLLRIGEPRLQSVAVYQQGAGGWKVQRSGIGMPATDRPVAHREHLFPVEIASGERSVILFRVVSPTAIALPVTVWQPSALLGASQTSSVLLGVSLGLVLGIGLFFLLVFAVLREAVYAWFGLAAMGLFAYTLAYEGVVQLYLGHWLGAWSLPPILVLTLLTQAAMVCFTLAFLRPRQSAPRLYRGLQGLLAGHLFLALLVLLLPYSVGAHLVSIWSVLTALLIIAAGVQSWAGGDKSARLFCLGFGLFWLVALVTLLEIFGLLPVQVGAVGRQTMWLFTLPVIAAAFSDRQLILNRERQHAQQQLLAAERDMVRRLETEVRRRTAEVENALRMATAASSAKDDFLATVTHELRTPLTTLVGAAELLHESVSSPEQRDLVAAQHQAGRHLLRLVDDLLDLARLDHYGMELSREPFSPRELLRNLIAMFRPEAEARGLALNLELGELPPALLGDSERIHQVLANLLVNAIKYTQTGGAVVQASASPTLNGQVTLSILVEDTGVGMEPRLRRVAFQPFEQGASDNPGIGLGLSIVARLLAAMDGSVTVDSEPGLGSRFHVHFPLPLAEPGEEGEEAVAGESSHLLLVEDVPENRLIISRLLRGAGHEVVSVADGAGALSALQEESFDAVLLDLGLPDIDGVEVARRIRATGASACGVRLIALTARAQGAGDLPGGLFDAVLGKPLDRSALRRALEGRQGASGRRAEGADAPPEELDLSVKERELLHTLHRRTCMEVVDSLRRALDAGAMREVAAAAHRLSGSAAQVGRQELAALARAAERAAGHGDPGPARDLLRRLANAAGRG